jgi:protein SCO1/2
MCKTARIESLVIAAMFAGGVALGGVQVAVADDAHHHDAHHHAAPTDAKPKAARVTLHDIQLVDAEGQAVRFKSEAVGSRIVVVGFIYTSCTTICPVTSMVLGNVQERLIEKLRAQFGREVKLITLTVDPATDTPERLKAYAANFGSPTGWLWLTGDKPQVDRVLTGLGAYAADFTRHAGAILVGDGRSGDWMRFYGLPNPPNIVDRVEQLLAARRSASLTDRR